MSKLLTKSAVSLGVAAALGASGAALGASHAGGGPKFEFHGDLNNRFLIYSDQNAFFAGQGTSDEGSDENFGEFKYRMWTTAETNDGGVKGVYAIEIGGVKFGRGGVGRSQGGAFSGDGANVETRWAYVDMGLPSNKSTRIKFGLQPFSLNEHKWVETASGIQFTGNVNDSTSYKAGWARGNDAFNQDDSLGDDLDLFFARFDFAPAKGAKIGVFGLVERADDEQGTGAIDLSDRSPDGGGAYSVKFIGDNLDISIVTVGIDGSYKPSNWFLDWTAMYQDGSVDNHNFTGTDGTNVQGDFDLQAWLFAGSLGVNLGDTTVKYELLYASGDDDPSDTDFDAFMATDVDNADTIIFNEDGMTDDDYLTELPYLFDKGYLLNKISVNHKVTAKTSVGAHAAYVMTAEDIEYFDDAGNRRSEDTLGTELAVRLKHMIYPNLEFQTTIAYLLADDGMDFFDVDGERDGDGDNDIFHWGARVRYKF